MIYLRVSSENEKALEQVAETLILQRLVIDLNVRRNIERWYRKDGKVLKKKVHLLTSKTKGLLFGKIDKTICKMHPEVVFEIYSMPILHMDWEETKQLQSEVVEV